MKYTALIALSIISLMLIAGCIGRQLEPNTVTPENTATVEQVTQEGNNAIQTEIDANILNNTDDVQIGDMG